MDDDDLNFLINHIVFPVQLPDESSGDDKENLFLQIVKDVIDKMHSNEIFKNDLKRLNQFKQIINMFVLWEKLQGFSNKLDEKEYLNAINKLETGQSLAIYVRAQNTCLNIKPISNDKAVIYMFQASLENDKIMSTSKDFEISYPAQSIVTNKLDAIRTEEFSKLIADLTNLTFDESKATSHKAGQNHEEIRYVTNTKLISEWLFSDLVSNETNLANLLPTKVSKKYRDNIIISKILPFRRSG